MGKQSASQQILFCKSDSALRLAKARVGMRKEEAVRQALAKQLGIVQRVPRPDTDR